MLFDIYNALLPKQRFSLTLILAITQLLLIIIFSSNIIDVKNNYKETIGFEEVILLQSYCNCYDPYNDEWKRLPITSDWYRLGKSTNDFLISEKYEVIKGGFLNYYFGMISIFIIVSFFAFIVPIIVYYIIYIPM